MLAQTSLPLNRMQSLVGRARHSAKRAGVLRKGGPKRKNSAGKTIHGVDLNDHFRFVPDDPTRTVLYRGEDGKTKRLDRGDAFYTAYGKKPNYLDCFVLGFDHLAAIDPQSAEFDRQLKRWASATVYAGNTRLAETDAYGIWLTGERVKGRWRDYAIGEKPVPITLNAHGNPNFNRLSGVNEEMYQAEDGKLHPYRFSGNISLSLPAYEAMGVYGFVEFTTSSKNEIIHITNELRPFIASGMPLSYFPMIIFRQQDEITSPNFDNSKDVTWRRQHRQKTRKWLVHFEPSPELANALSVGRVANANAQLRAISIGQSVSAEPTALLQPVPVPEPTPDPRAGRTPDYVIETSDGERVEAFKPTDDEWMDFPTAADVEPTVSAEAAPSAPAAAPVAERKHTLTLDGLHPEPWIVDWNTMTKVEQLVYESVSNGWPAALGLAPDMPRRHIATLLRSCGLSSMVDPYKPADRVMWLRAVADMLTMHHKGLAREEMIDVLRTRYDLHKNAIGGATQRKPIVRNVPEKETV